jgi:tRNA(Ile)-lysidine synthase
MKYIVAVSGGIDSVVLLDILVKENKHDLVIAHFDHGIRPESDADARFAEGLAEKYDIPIELGIEQLGPKASEALARQRRYAFLRRVAKLHSAKLVTAHHMDDMIETVAINLTRGTGWRGLAVFGDSSIDRPLLAMTKRDMYDYALKHSLEWVEDETNSSDAYLRNRLRKKVNGISIDKKHELERLYRQQTQLRDQIGKRTTSYTGIRSRYFFIMLPESVALELLRRITSGRLLSVQLTAVLLMIKTARAGATMTAGAGCVIKFTKREFVVENTGRML